MRPKRNCPLMPRMPSGVVKPLSQAAAPPSFKTSDNSSSEAIRRANATFPIVLSCPVRCGTRKARMILWHAIQEKARMKGSSIATAAKGPTSGCKTSMRTTPRTKPHRNTARKYVAPADRAGLSDMFHSWRAYCCKYRDPNTETA
uniref:Uncharacterized protein n=1 Tax=Tetraselmis sp. GSL018 TaxID=582737 RepID=A0A061SKG8_9CHLO